jgi:hypothetical protein
VVIVPVSSGSRAPVRPAEDRRAPVARYFDGKEGLYLAALAEGTPTQVATEPHELLRGMLCNPERRRNSPVMRALVSPALSDAVRDQVRTALDARATGRIAAALEEQGADDARLRAELLMALMIGVSLTRSNGTLDAIADADPEHLLEVLAPVAEALTGYTTSSAA